MLPTQTSQFSFNRLDCGQVRLHVAQIGSGPPIIFLHGFPEHWRAFAPMMMALSGRFTCIAPDQRGYGLSDRPEDTQAYHLDSLAADVAGLVTALGYQKVSIVAHDWGGLVAWHFAGLYADLLERLVVFNAPHPFCLQAALDGDPDQRKASSYAAGFASMEVESLLADQDQSALWDRFFAADAAKGILTPRDKAAQIALWGKPGAWQAMLNWYRAAGFDYSGHAGKARPAPPRIDVPFLLVWGDSDPLFAPSALHGLTDIAPKCQIKVFANGGHAVFREQPQECAALIEAFLTGPDPENSPELLDLP
jgi:epoxide hydrolase 4